jgi:hypothetical protein
MSLKFSNFGKAVIASAPSGTTGLSFTVEAGKGLLFPALGAGDYFYGIFKDASGNHEIVKVSARSTDSMTIAVGGRGLDGTTARTWAAGDYFVAGLVNAALTESLANALLSAIGGLTTSDDKTIYFTGLNAAALTPLTAFMRTVLAAATDAEARNLLGAAGAAFTTGTSMLFYNSVAPTGWAHDASALDHTLRVVAGGGIGGVSGGTVNFTTAFASQAVTGTNSAVTLTTSQIPSHTHTYRKVDETGTPAGGTFFNGSIGSWNTYNTGAAGGGASHNHTFTGTAIDLRVKYLNVIRATKT